MGGVFLCLYLFCGFISDRTSALTDDAVTQGRPETLRWGSNPGPEVPALTIDKEAVSGKWKKVSSPIRQSIARLDGLKLDTQARLRYDFSEFSTPLMIVRRDGAARVMIYVEEFQDAARNRLEEIGFELTFDGSEEFHFIEGWLPLDSVERSSRLGFVKMIREAARPVARAGGVISQGDQILLADRARAEFGVSGRNIKVGVISDSVDGLAQAQASGDLPGNLEVLKAGVGAGEGTAMLEIVHDLAPGADLSFFGPQTSGEMITGIRQLAAAGARVIVDDLAFLNEPFYEDGPISQVVNEVAAQGVIYVSAAGNSAQSHYESTFSGTGPRGGPTSNVHTFGSTIFQEIVVPGNSTGIVLLQWSNKVGGAIDDYDIYITSPGGQILFGSIDEQEGDGFPIEAVSVPNNSPNPATFNVVIDLFRGSPQRIEMYYFGMNRVEFTVPQGSIFGHPAASGAIAVGTINADNPGNESIAIYSSQGPCEISFPSSEFRQKPDITGIDAVRVSGAAGFPRSSPGIFAGTSAAAPHIAAIAALMLEANPALTPANLADALKRTGADLGNPGADTIYGGGRANALEAVRAVRGGNEPPALRSLQARLEGDTLTLTGTATDPDRDISQARVNILDGANAPLGATRIVPVTAGAGDNFSLSLDGLNQLPAGVRASVALLDSRGNQSGLLVADFSLADPGGPTLSNVTYSGTKMVIKGNGLSGELQLEINGQVVRTINGTGSKKLKVKGNATVLNLRAGANRVRIRINLSRSNIIVLTL